MKTDPNNSRHLIEEKKYLKNLFYSNSLEKYHTRQSQITQVLAMLATEILLTQGMQELAIDCIGIMEYIGKY